jgi:hypothetical protein
MPVAPWVQSEAGLGDAEESHSHIKQWWRVTMAASAVRDKKIAVGLILALLFGFYAISITVEYVQAADHGYGTGFTNQYHVPASVVRQVAATDNLKIPANISASALSSLTQGDHSNSAWNETWRWVLTALACALVLVFWYVVLSRLGTL